MRERDAKMMVAALSPQGKRWCYMETRPGGIIFELEDGFEMKDFWTAEEAAGANTCPSANGKKASWEQKAPPG